MSKVEQDINNLSDEQQEFLDYFSAFENQFINYFSFLNNIINNQNEKIKILNSEVVSLREILDKKSNLLSLELESNLDKHKQLQTKTQNKLDEISFLLDNCVLKDVGYDLKYPSFKSKETNPDSTNYDFSKHNDELLNDLKRKVEDLNNMLSYNDSKLSNLNQNIVDKDEIINSLVDRITFLDEKIKIDELNLNEKDTNLNFLVAQNNILKSIIDEKDKTIDSLTR